VRSEVLLVLLALAPHLDRNEDEDHVHNHPDPDEGDDQTYILAEGGTRGEKHCVFGVSVAVDENVPGAYQPRLGSLTMVVAHRIHIYGGEVPERLNGRDWKSRNGG
jgi:hypothetical protein